MKFLQGFSNFQYEHKTWAGLLFRLAFFTMMLFIASSSLANTSLRHTITFIGAVLLDVIALKQCFSAKYKFREYFSLAVILALLIIGYAGAETVRGWRLFYECASFLCLYVFSTTDIKQIYSYDIMKFIIAVSVAVIVIVFIASFGSNAYINEDGYDFREYLVLGMTGANFTGMVLLGIYGIVIIAFSTLNQKFILIAFAAVLNYLIMLTHARTCLLASFIITAYALYFYRFRIPDLLIAGTALSAVIFVPLYLFMFYSLGLQDFVFLNNKTFFSGRQYTYIGYLQALNNKYLFGNLGAIHFSNAHNGALVIMCSIGIIGLIVVYANFIMKLLEINKRADTVQSKMALICILAMYLQSCGEAGLFMGHFILVIFLYTYMIFAQKRIKIYADS